MPLWGKTDADASKPKYINLDNYPAGTQLVFVDENEAQVESNKAKGLISPGWYLYRESTNSNGEPRYSTELLVAIVNTAEDAGDAEDDDTVSDVNVAITIDTQPADQTAVAGEATFSVVASIEPAGTVTYQWQKKLAGTTRWVLVDGATSADLELSGLVAENNGDQYRVLLAGDGAKRVTSAAATLTVAEEPPLVEPQ
jgi:hypothetical protein